ncbi:MAG: hypothetical protein SNH01_06315 [Rikenellaceae bacterium]
MSRVRDMLMMAQQSSSLPYIELEAIEGTGTQWINSKLTPQSNITVELIAQLGSDEKFVFGSRIASKNQQFVLTQSRLDVGSSQTNYSYTHGSVATYRVAESQLYVDDELIATNSNTIPENNLNIYLMTCNSNNTVNSAYNNIGIWYSWVVQYGDEVVQDLIPVILTEDVDGGSAGEVGMWDKATNTFFGNSGTGEFIAHYKN